VTQVFAVTIAFGYREHVTPGEVLPEQFLGLEMAATRADVFVITLPLTNQTHGLVGPRIVAALPSHAWLVNVAGARSSMKMR
jgi:phosphoglycerate dehydrogenase-like enzyme